MANTSADARRDSRFRYYTFAASARQVAGPALISFDGASTFPDTTALFGAALGLAVVSVGLGLPLRRSVTARTEGEAGTTGGTRRLLRAPGLFRALLASSVVLAAVDISLAYFPALGQERRYSATLISALLGVRAAATFLALAVPLTPPLLFVVALAGLALGVGQPLTMSWVAGMAPVSLRVRPCPCASRATASARSPSPRPGSRLPASGLPGVFAATGLLLAVAALAVRGLPMDDSPPN